MHLMNWTIRRSRMLGLIQNLEQLHEPAMSLYMESGDKIEDFKIPVDIPREESIPEELFVIASRSLTGAIFFWGQGGKYMVIPPFPVTRRGIYLNYEIGVLKSMLEIDYTIAIILIRLGSYGIGLFDGEKLLECKTGGGLVHARHKKGGSSQRRFERHRQKQIEYFFKGICQKAREKLSPYLQQVDFVYYGGERNTINLFLKRCDFCAGFASKAATRLLNIREPGQASLRSAIQDVYSCRVMQAVREVAPL